MARVRVKIHVQALRELMQTEELVGPKAEANAAACNAQSSWGGYEWGVGTDGIRARATVWTYARQDGGGNSERANRMIRNLDAG